MGGIITAHRAHDDKDAFERLADFDAIYFGAVGDPPCLTMWLCGADPSARQRFDQHVNSSDGCCRVTSPPRTGAADIDMTRVRENSEGEYTGIGDVCTQAPLRDRRADGGHTPQTNESPATR